MVARHSRTWIPLNAGCQFSDRVVSTQPPPPPLVSGLGVLLPAPRSLQCVYTNKERADQKSIPHGDMGSWGSSHPGPRPCWVPFLFKVPNPDSCAFVSR